MSPPPDIHDLARQLAVLEERMNTLQADLTATLEGFRTDQAKVREDMARHREDAARRETQLNVGVDSGMARLREDLTRRDTEAARRETRLIFAMIATVAIGLTVFGFVTA